MTLAAIELADPGIVVMTDDGSTVGPSPGVALLEGEAPIVGTAAAMRHRLQPRRIHDRYWEQLDTEPLARPHPDHLRTADIAHAQLVELWTTLDRQVDAVVVTVPASLDRTRLGLLLGIARAAGIPVRGFVDSAVASVVTRDRTPGALVHVDVLLHRVVVTRLAVGHEISTMGFETDDRIGLVGLRDAWSRAVAGQFVRATRFDPLKLAATEQQLYDRVPGLVEQIDSSTPIQFVMAAGGLEYEVELTGRTFENACEVEVGRIESLVSRCCDGDDAAIALSHRAAGVPGLTRRLRAQTNGPVDALGLFAAARGTLLAAADIIGEAEGDAAFVTRLPRRGPGVAIPPEDATADGGVDPSGPSATHILHRGTAYPISTTPLVVGAAAGGTGRALQISGNTAGISRIHCSILLRDGRAVVEDHSTYGSFVNELRVDGSTELVAGDRIRLGSPGVELKAIAVEAGDD